MVSEEVFICSALSELYIWATRCHGIIKRHKVDTILVTQARKACIQVPATEEQQIGNEDGVRFVLQVQARQAAVLGAGKLLPKAWSPAPSTSVSTQRGLRGVGTKVK